MGRKLNLKKKKKMRTENFPKLRKKTEAQLEPNKIEKDLFKDPL